MVTTTKIEVVTRHCYNHQQPPKETPAIPAQDEWTTRRVNPKDFEWYVPAPSKDGWSIRWHEPEWATRVRPKQDTIYLHFHGAVEGTGTTWGFESPWFAVTFIHAVFGQ